MKVLFRGALVLWVVSGFALHAYHSRVAQGTVAVEQKRDLHQRELENNDEVARRIRESQWDTQSKLAMAYASWAFVGFVLALRGVHLLFRKADRVSDVEKFLAGSLVLLLLTGCIRQPFEPVKLETIGPNEEGVLISHTGDARKQISTNNEEFLRANLMASEKTRLPQQWILLGYESSAGTASGGTPPSSSRWTGAPSLASGPPTRTRARASATRRSGS